MLSLLLLGCSPDLLKAFVPTVNFDRIEIQDLDFEHIDTQFVFRVDNPNPVGIPLERFAYNLSFEGVDILSGNATDDLNLEAADSSEIALPVSLIFSYIYDLVDATRGEDTIAFQLDGAFGFDSDIGPIDVSYEAENEFPALRIPEIKLNKLQLQNVDLSGANFALDFSVDNDHGSAINLHDMDFDLDIAGVNIGGQLATVGEVPGATTDTFSLPFGISFLEAAQAIAAVASGEKLNVDFGADVDVDTPFGIIPLNFDKNGDVSVQQAP